MEWDYNKINNDLKNMRERMEVLEFRKRNFRFPKNLVYIAYSLINDKNLSKYNSLKQNINQTYKSLKNEYPKLREIYSNRFDSLGIEDLLKISYDKSERIKDLEDRRRYLLTMKKNNIIYFKRNKDITNLVKDIDIELDRRKRNINDLLEEVESDRGISFEIILTNKMMENIFNN